MDGDRQLSPSFFVRMKPQHVLIFLMAFTLTFFSLAGMGFGAVPQTKKPAAKKAASQQPKGKAVAGKSTAKSTKAATGKGAARKGGKAPVKPAPFRSRQLQPTQERYREIQQALVEKGYLKSEPTGVWGPESIDALKQFQGAQNIPVSGKLNSRSIIGLGLGPKTAGPLVVPPPEPSAVRPQ